MMVTSKLAAPTPADQKAQLGKASQQFEAIFIRQMLASARAAKLADGAMDNSAVAQFQSMQDSNFADLMSAKGGLGLGATIERQLSGLVGGKDQK